MQDMINDGLTILIVCLVIAVVATALIVLRPWKRRQRQRKRHSHRPRIDLFKDDPSEPVAKTDA